MINLLIHKGVERLAKTQVIRSSCMSFAKDDVNLKHNRRKLIGDFVNKLRLCREHVGSFRFLKFPILRFSKPYFDKNCKPGLIDDVIMCEVIFT